MRKTFHLTGFVPVFLLLVILAVSCGARTLTGKVVKVSDGDTFTLLLDGGSTVRVRLHGIDAPEIRGGQPYSRAAREHLADMIAGRTVAVDVRDTDRYGRSIGVVSTSDVADVNLEMLRAGMAWHYSHYDSTPAYRDAERAARRDGLGLWRDRNPVNPYDWRRKK